MPTMLATGNRKRQPTRPNVALLLHSYLAHDQVRSEAE
jgi:hypothetical protein